MKQTCCDRCGDVITDKNCIPSDNRKPSGEALIAKPKLFKLCNARVLTYNHGVTSAAWTDADICIDCLEVIVLAEISSRRKMS